MNRIDKNKEELITNFIRFSHIWMNQRNTAKITEIELDTKKFEGRNEIKNFRRKLSNIREAGEYDMEEKQFLVESRKWFLKEFKNQMPDGSTYTNFLK